MWGDDWLISEEAETHAYCITYSIDEMIQLYVPNSVRDKVRDVETCVKREQL